MLTSLQIQADVSFMEEFDIYAINGTNTFIVIKDSFFSRQVRRPSDCFCNNQVQSGADCFNTSC